MTSDWTSDRGASRPRDESDHIPTPSELRAGWLYRRRQKVIAEIERNRRGEYLVPTWLLVAAVLAIVAGWAALVIFG